MRLLPGLFLRALLSALLVAAVLGAVVFVVAALLRSSGELCLLNAPPDAGAVSQELSLLPPRLTCYFSDSATPELSLDGEVATRLIGVCGVSVALLVVLGLMLVGLWRAPFSSRTGW